QEAVVEPQIFIGQLAMGRDKRRRYRSVEHFDPRTTRLDIAGRHLLDGLALKSIFHHAASLDDQFGTDAAGISDLLLPVFGPSDGDLCNPVAVAQVDKNGAAVVAFALDPAAKRRVGAYIGFAQLAAGVGA